MKKELFQESVILNHEIADMKRILDNLSNCSSIAFIYDNGNTAFKIDINNVQSAYSDLKSHKEAESIFAAQSLKAYQLIKRHLELLIVELERDFEAL